MQKSPSPEAVPPAAAVVEIWRNSAPVPLAQGASWLGPGVCPLKCYEDL